jgi:hypothetical protein
MRSRFALLSLPLSVVIALGCDSGSAPDASKKAPAAPATVSTTKTPTKKGGRPPRRPVAESKNFNLSPGDD